MTKKLTVCLMTLATVCTIATWLRPAAAATGCVRAPAGVISWWPGDGSARDLTGAHDGELYYGTGFALGKVGRAFNLDGEDDFVNVPNVASVGPITSTITVEGWIKPQMPTTTSDMYLFARRTPYNSESFSIDITSSGKISVILRTTDDSRPSGSSFTTGPVITFNRWQHIAVTLNTSTQEVHVYRNSWEVVANPVGDAILTGNLVGADSLYIGRRQYIASEGQDLAGHYKGLIDEISLYSTDLTAAQIRSIYNAGSAGKCPVITKAVTNTNDSGPGSLRTAINFANNNPGTAIKFRIPMAQGTDIDAGQPGGDAAADVFVIRPSTALPTLNRDKTHIDGATQATFLGSDTNPGGPEIVLDGSNAGLADGLVINAANCEIKKLVITNYAAGIWIGGAAAHHNIVEGCYLGIDAGGTVAQGTTRGVMIDAGAHDNIIGGTTAAARNIIVASGTQGAGIHIRYAGSDNNVVQGNYIGTDRTGTAVLGTGFFGILINAGPQHNLIGGTEPGARNVIAAQSENTLGITFSDKNIVQGNYIGTDVTGTVALGNGSYGMVIYAGSGNVIGGTSTGARNVISGNHKGGVRIMSEPGVPATANNIVQGNYIGTNAGGTVGVGNQIIGVRISGNAHDNVIGLALNGAGLGNRIAFNDGDGVLIFVPTDGALAMSNTIRGNSIYSNGGLGINLQPEGEAASTVTPNDPGDGDNGPNNLQNFPTLISVAATSSATTITGTLKSTPGMSYKIDFYRNPAADSSGFGEGKVHIGSTSVTTNSNGRAELIVTLPIDVPIGHFVTATATNSNTGDTSEFSRALAVTSASTTSSSTKVAVAVPDRSRARLSFVPLDNRRFR